MQIFLIFGSYFSSNFREISEYFNQNEKYSYLKFTTSFKKILSELNLLKDSTEAKEKLVITIAAELINTIYDYENLPDLIKVSNLAIFISSNSEQYFTDCLLNDRNKNQAINNDWPKYVETTKNIIENLHFINHFIIFNFVLKSVINNINDNDPIDATFLIQKERLFQLINEEIKQKDNHQIKELIIQNQRNFFSSFFEKNWFANLKSNNPKLKLETIDEIVKMYENRGTMSAVKRTAFLGIIVNSKYPISSLLITEAIELNKQCNLINIKLQNDSIIARMIVQLECDNPDLQRLILIIDLLASLGKHIIFCHKIFNDLEILQLVYDLLQSKFYKIKSKATYFIKLMLDIDHKRYGSLIISFDNDKPIDKSFVQLITKLFLELNLPFLENDNEMTADDQEISKYNDSICNDSHSSALILLLKGSLTNCQKIEKSALLKQLVSHAINCKFDYQSIHLFGILNMLVKYGSFNKWINLIDICKLLDKVNKVIVCLAVDKSNRLPNKWSKSTDFYKSLLAVIKNNSEESNLEEDLPTLEEEETIQMDLTQLSSIKGSKRDLIVIFNDLKRKIAQDEPIRILKKQTEFVTICIENKELELENDELKNRLKALELTVLNLNSEIERLELDRNSKLEDCNKLRSLLKTTENEKESFENMQPNDNLQHQTSEITLESDDLFLKDVELNKIEITKEVAKRFIVILGNKRKNLKEFRSLICGSLKHLSENLYTSPMHFFSEIIQNFEDNIYDQSSKPWFMRIVLDSDYILFCSNENGFQPSDVLSICSLSESVKEKGKQNGHKGIGFKSVFVCSDQPMIVSKEWRFQFKKSAADDELAYITPYYLDELPLTLTEQIESNKNCNTFIYLPLKDKYSKQTNFNEQFPSNINELILLFTKNIERIVIENKINQIETTINCSKETIKTIERIEFLQSNFNNIKLSNSLISVETHFKSLNELKTTKMSIYSCECSIAIPEDLKKEENMKINETILTIGFPIELNAEQTFPIFAFLPIYDIGFRFIMNSYWSLTTYRESINEHAAINSFFRNNLAKLFIWLTTNDSRIKSKIHQYLPKIKDLKTNNWWLIFVDDILKEIKPVLNELITQNFGNKSLITRIYNQKLDEIIDENILNLIGFKLIKPNESLSESYYLEFCGLEKLTIKDVLIGFNTQISSTELIEWKRSRSQTWWEQTFRLLKLETINQKDIDNIQNLEIFLIQQKKETFRASFDNKVKYYVSKDSNLEYYWNDKLKLVNFESNSEKNFLIKVLQIPELYTEELIEQILINNKNKLNEPINQPETNKLWLDLDFIKNNYNFCLDLNNNYNLPSQNKLLPISWCSIRTLLGIDLTQLPIVQQCNFIDFDSSALTLNKILEWELFLIDLGCSLPIFDSDKIKEKINNNEILPMFQFDSLNKEDSILALAILNKIEGSKLSEIIRKLPVNVNGKLIPIEKTFHRKLFIDYLPSIDITDHCLDLYAKLGVTIELNFESCYKVLRSFVDNKIQKSELYREWLMKLNQFKSEKSTEVEQIVYLNTVNDNQLVAFKPSDIYCCENSIGILKLCKYVNKTLINSNYNMFFQSVQSDFVSLGSHNRADIDHILESMCQISKQKSLFINNNYQNTLNVEGYEDMKELYLLLEDCLVYLLKNSGYTKNLTELNLIQRDELSSNNEIKNLLNEKQINLLEIITIEHHLVKYSEFATDRIVCCFNSAIINTLRQNLNYSGVFIDPKIALDCPLTMSFLKLDYLYSNLDIYLEHTTKNLEETNDHLNQLFQEATNINDIEVLKVKFLNISCCRNPIVGIKFAIFDKKIVVCTITDSWQSQMSVYSMALQAFLKLIHPNKSDESLAQEAIDKILNIKQQLSNPSNWKVSQYGSSEATKFNLNDIIFPNDDFDSTQFNESYFSGNDQRTIGSGFNSANRIRFIYLNDIVCYDNRVKQIDKISVNDKTSLANNTIQKSTAPFTNIDTKIEAQKRIGIKAELFFCRFLKSKYFESFNELECWVSSSLNSVYPSSTPKFDDSLGFDFKIEDYLHLFSTARTRSDLKNKLCFIEVKGCADQWDGTFHISKNEISKKDSIIRDCESYIIVVVECVSDPNRINIARIINWTNDLNIIETTPEQFLAKFNPNFDSNPNRNFDQNHSRTSNYQNQSGYNNRNNYGTRNNRNACNNDDNGDETWSRQPPE